jgi:hypothetical protein
METAINTHTKKSLYAKRPIWQWVAIYIVVGAIVYGAIYLFFINKGYGYTNMSYPSQQTQQQNPY